MIAYRLSNFLTLFFLRFIEQENRIDLQHRTSRENKFKANTENAPTILLPHERKFYTKI